MDKKDKAMITALRLQVGDVIFTRNNWSLTSYAIRLLQTSLSRGLFEWSHVCIAGEDGTIYTTGATSRSKYGVLKTRYGKVDANDYLCKQGAWTVKRWHEGLTDTQKERMVGLNEAMCGREYDVTSLLAGIVKLFRLKGLDGQNKGRRRLFCAEAVAHCYNTLGLFICDMNTDADGYSVDEIYYSDKLKFI